MHSILMKSLIFLPLLASDGIVIASPIRPLSDAGGSFDLLLTWSPFGFLGNVSIGTPPQQVTTFVDWTWISQYVFTTTCQGDPERTLDCFAKDQAIFNQSLSHTYRNESALYPSRTWNPNHFFFYEDLTVDYASDIETIGPSSARLIIQAADQQFDLTEAPYPFAGVYGLSPVFKGDNGTPRSPQLSLHLLIYPLPRSVHTVSVLPSLACRCMAEALRGLPLLLQRIGGHKQIYLPRPRWPPNPGCIQR